MRIAMIGQRGVPATFGGIERHVEELGSRLVQRGHDVTVFCRTNYVTERPSSYRGMTLRHLPTVGTKHADAIAHSALSTAATLRSGFDVIHYHALGPGLLTPFPRARRGTAVVQTIHGRDDERAKWGLAARLVLRSASRMSASIPHVTIGVSKELRNFYFERYGKEIAYIPNGVDPATVTPPGTLLEDLGLTPRRYVLFVGRLVPEKAPDLLIRAFRRLHDESLRLAIVGGTSFTNRYVESLTEAASLDRRVCLTGPRYGAELQELYSNAALFVLPSNLEGLPLTLLEASSYGLPIVASDIAPHLEIVGEEGCGHRTFAPGDESGLLMALERSLECPEAERRGAKLLQETVLDTFNWDEAAEQTEAVYMRACSMTRGAVRGSRR